MIRKILAFLATLSLACAPALAQSSAQPVLPGLLVTSGCPTGVTACWVPYSNTNPLPVSGGGGGGGGAVTAAAGSYVAGALVQLPTTLGAKTGALSLSVVPNTDTAFPVTGTFWQTTQPVSIQSITPDANNNLPVANRASIFFNGATGAGSALTGSATFTGATRDSGYAVSTYNQFAYFNSFFLTDQAGTASIECSNDNSTWYTCATAAVVAVTPLILQIPVLTRYHRSKLVNGSSAETYLWINSGYTGS